VVDPLSIATGTVTGQVAAILRERIQKYFKSGTTDRLFRLLDQRFGAHTGLTVSQLQTWTHDERFRVALFFVEEGEWDEYRPMLREAVLTQVAADPAAPQDHEAQLVDDVVRAIEDLLPKAKEGDELARYHHALTQASIEAVNVRWVRLDWVPQRAKQLVDALIEEEPAQGAQLEAALQTDSATAVRGLVRQPPSWAANGSGYLWAAIAAIAESHGLWEQAQQAWEFAADRPGGDRARALMRARLAAGVLGREERAAELLAQARSVDPNHPLVLIDDAREEEDGERRLETLGQAEPREARYEAMLHAERAAALTVLERFDEAETEADQAKTAAPDLGRAREVEAALVVARERIKWLAGHAVDREALLRAGQELIALRDEHRELKAYGGGVSFLVAAADAYWLADAPEETARLLAPKALPAEELDLPLARRFLAEAAIRVGHPAYALEILPESDVTDDGDRLIRAAAASFVGEQRALKEASGVLDELVADGGPLAAFAARQRLLVAVERKQEWSDAAEALLSDADAALAAIFKARWLATRERYGEAENALLPYAAELRVKYQLVGLAHAEGDDRKTAERARAVLADDADRGLRLECAEALVNLGDDAGVEPLRRLAEDEAAPRWIRVRALARLAGRAQALERHGEVVALTEPWLELAPEDRRAGFSRAQALLRQGDFAGAREVLERHGLVPERREEALLAGRIWALTLPPREAVLRIGEAVDRLPEPDEELERLIVVTALELPEAAAQRTRVDRFLERFPNSRAFGVLEAEEGDEEGLIAAITELVRAKAERATDVERRVFRDGSAPLATLAHVVGKTLGELLFLARRIPLGYGEEALARAEVDDALAAIGLGAVWDQTSLFVVGGLGDDLLPAALQALQKSVICQSALDDCITDRARPQSGDERMDLVFNRVAGEAELIPWAPDDVARDRHRSEGMLALAQGLEVEPDLLESDTGPEADTARRFEDLSVPLRSYLGTLAVAGRLKLPVFSDDRCVRLRAREAGLDAFGSLALLEALIGREQLQPADRARIRQRLRHVGGMGTAPSAEELIEEARAAGWGITRSLAQALLDRHTILYRPGEGIRLYIQLLRAAHREAPDCLTRWVARSLNALHTSFPHLSFATCAQYLLLTAWEPWEDDGADFLAALIAAIREAARPLGTVGDFVVDTTRLLMKVFRESDLDLDLGIAMRRRAIEQLPRADRSRARLIAFLS